MSDTQHTSVLSPVTGFGERPCSRKVSGQQPNNVRLRHKPRQFSGMREQDMTEVLHRRQVNLRSRVKFHSRSRTIFLNMSTTSSKGTSFRSCRTASSRREDKSRSSGCCRAVAATNVHRLCGRATNSVSEFSRSARYCSNMR